MKITPYGTLISTESTENWKSGTECPLIRTKLATYYHPHCYSKQKNGGSKFIQGQHYSGNMDAMVSSQQAQD